MRLLVIRFSALGDVAMTVPVLVSLARQYPDVSITMLSRPFVLPLFEESPPNLHFKGVDLSRYKGAAGLYRLFRELKREGNYDAIADLHDVLRTKILRTLFRWTGAKVAHIDKGRKEKRALTEPRRKALKQLPSSFDRYEEVFGKLGYPVQTAFRSIFEKGKADCALFSQVTGIPDGKHWIGIAPFAAHNGKKLPQATTLRLIHELSANSDWRIFLFGGGKAENELLEQWAANSPDNVLSVAGKLKLKGELALMSTWMSWYLWTRPTCTLPRSPAHLSCRYGVPRIHTPDSWDGDKASTTPYRPTFPAGLAPSSGTSLAAERITPASPGLLPK